MSEGPRRKSLRCDACGADIAVRTFKAGAVACPACGATRDLGVDLAERMRAVQRQAQATQATATGTPGPTPAPTQSAVRRSRLPWVLALALGLLGLAAWLARS